MPFSKWSENYTSLEPPTKVTIPSEFLAAVRKCQQYVIYFYLPNHFRRSRKFVRDLQDYHPFSESVIIVSDEEKSGHAYF